MTDIRMHDLHRDMAYHRDYSNSNRKYAYHSPSVYAASRVTESCDTDWHECRTLLSTNQWLFIYRAPIIYRYSTAPLVRL